MKRKQPFYTSLLFLSLLWAVSLWAQAPPPAQPDSKSAATVATDAKERDASKVPVKPSPAATTVRPKPVTTAKTDFQPGSEPKPDPQDLARDVSAAPSQTSRTVKVGPKDITALHCNVRFETLVVLPDTEKILDISTGDMDFWKIEGVAHFCHVKPSQPNISTNLHIITAAGHIYSFFLRETSKDPAAHLDHKVFMEPSEAMLAESQGKPRFVDIGQLENYKRVMEDELQKLQSSQRGMLTEVTRFKSEYPSQLVFDYEFRAPKVIPVSAIYRDDKFTYIKCSAKEKPALYEIKEGQPNLVNFQLQGDTYIVDRVLDEGYLQVGKTKMSFKRKAS